MDVVSPACYAEVVQEDAGVPVPDADRCCGPPAAEFDVGQIVTHLPIRVTGVAGGSSQARSAICVVSPAADAAVV